MKITTLALIESKRSDLILGFRMGDSYCFRMRCRALLLQLSKCQIWASQQLKTLRFA